MKSFRSLLTGEFLKGKDSEAAGDEVGSLRAAHSTLSGDPVRHRDVAAWKSWRFSEEHAESFVESQKFAASSKSAFLATVKRVARRGSLPSEQRRKIWLGVLDIKLDSDEYKKEEQRYMALYKRSVGRCPGCKSFNVAHLSTFGAGFLHGSGVLWQENLFDKHALSPFGEQVAKRILLALHEKWQMDYCPQIPDLVCLLLLFLGEFETFLVLDRILVASRKNTRWNNTRITTYLPNGKVDEVVFVRSFLSLLEERQPVLYRTLVDFARDQEEVESLFARWFARCFVNMLPLRFVVRVLDCLLVEGAKVYYRIALALLRNFRTHIIDACSKKRKGDFSLEDLMEECLVELGSVHESKLALANPFSTQGGGEEPANEVSALPTEGGFTGLENPSKFQNFRIQTEEKNDGTMVVVSDLASEDGSECGYRAETPRKDMGIGGYLQKTTSGDFADEDRVSLLDDQPKSPHFIRQVEFGQLHRIAREDDRTHLTIDRKSTRTLASNPENFILVQNRLGSKTFYSESSLLKASSAAGASMFNKLVGSGPTVTHLADDQSNFEFKVLLASAFAFRNLTSKTLNRKDDGHVKLARRDSLLQCVDHFVPSHFPESFVADSTMINTPEVATMLVSHLPKPVRQNSRSLKRLYSTESHGRSLLDLYTACDASGELAGSFILIECLNSENRESTVIGGYISESFRFSPHYGGDQSTFLFRIRPVENTAFFEFQGNVKGVGTSSVTPRHRLRAFSQCSETSWDSSGFSSLSEIKGSYEEASFVDHLEQASRTKFVLCGSNALVFGTTSSIYRSQVDGKVVEPDDIESLSDEEVRKLDLKEELSGPGLWVDGELVRGHTGWCSTFANEPLCLANDCCFDRKSRNDRYFSIGNVEVWGIPKFPG